ncbi:zinc ribbon domain-containing protein [Myxococcota bacterium]|nr:zinc ribbon domain-containing protein [Myxococcota bacterium]
MPLYEFRCHRCEREFEDLVPMGTTSATCPGCGSADVERLASTAAFSVGGRMSTTGSSHGCSGCTSSNCGSCGSGGGGCGSGSCGCG